MNVYDFLDKTPAIGKLVVIEGTDRALAERALAVLEDRLLARAERDLNLDRMRGPELDSFKRVAEAIMAMPFLAERRVVVVRGVHDLRAAQRRELWEVAQTVPDGTTLVIEDLVPPTRKSKPEPFGQLAGKAALRIDTTATPEVRTRFIRDALTEAGATAETGAIAALSDSEEDLGALRTDLEKLMLLGRRISREDVLGETLSAGEAKAWEFAGALVGGRTKEALRIVDELFTQDPRGAAIPLLSALAGEYLAVWELTRPGGELSAKMRWRERTLKPIAAKLGERRAKAGFERAVRGFEAIVIGRADDPRMVVELLVSFAA
ncbi:MAG TPA: hypothetical protein VGZ00_07040 [Candidatus Baltobacteraceae bacterium]|jgi:DNA polymerase III delta subunit|nr:hypothetical protein [Candidatus Baltobacteraceae bacterium]